MENWKVAVISVASTVAVMIIILVIAAIIQSGIIDVVKEEIEKDYCMSLPISEARDLEVCNDRT